MVTHQIATRRRKLILRFRAVHAWLNVHEKRRVKTAPLFYSLANRTHGKRLAGSSIWMLVSQVGHAIGVDV